MSAQSQFEFAGQFTPAPPIEWPLPLTYRQGGDVLLDGISVWHDFDWRVTIGHNRSAFKNGKSLAKFVRSYCEDKEGHLVLTTRTDVDEYAEENETTYVIVVKIREYLDCAVSDHSIGYFARVIGSSIANSASLAHIAKTPGAVDIALELLNGDSLASWIQKCPEVRIGEALSAICQAIESTGRAGHVSFNTGDFTKLVDLCLRHGGSEAIAASKVLDEDAARLNAYVGIQQLRSLLELWRTNEQNPYEDFWQKCFTARPFVLSQLFSESVLLLDTQVYVGGMGIDRHGAKLVDFLYANDFTRHLALVEIKTPATALMSSDEYRGGVFRPSKDSSGSLIQIMNYKSTLMKNVHGLQAQGSPNMLACDPKCYIVMGRISDLPAERVASWELFRNGLKHVVFVTFDEVFLRLEKLLNSLELGIVAASASPKSAVLADSE